MALHFCFNQLYINYLSPLASEIFKNKGNLVFIIPTPHRVWICNDQKYTYWRDVQDPSVLVFPTACESIVISRENGKGLLLCTDIAPTPILREEKTNELWGGGESHRLFFPWWDWLAAWLIQQKVYWDSVLILQSGFKALGKFLNWF